MRQIYVEGEAHDIFHASDLKVIEFDIYSNTYIIETSQISRGFQNFELPVNSEM